MTDGFQAAFIGAAGIAAAGSLMALALLRTPRTAGDEPAEQEGGDAERDGHRELVAA